MSEQANAAKRFLSLGIQEWGQGDEKRSKAAEQYLRSAGFDVIVLPAPFKHIVPSIKGKDKLPAMAWLQEVLLSMPRGKYEDEAEHLTKAAEAIVRSEVA